MLDDAQAVRMIEEIAKAKLGPENVVRVFTEPDHDWTGQAALRITIVITPGAIERISGDALVDNSYAIHTAFYEAQDERLPHVHYATEEELAAGDDPEC
jgi:hypothetical protein